MIVRVQHHDHVRAAPQRFEVAGLLVRAVPPVAFMDEGDDSQLARDGGCGISGCVVREDDFVHEIVRDRLVGAPQRFLGAEGRHHHDDALPAQHQR